MNRKAFLAAVVLFAALLVTGCVSPQTGADDRKRGEPDGLQQTVPASPEPPPTQPEPPASPPPAPSGVHDGGPAEGTSQGTRASPLSRHSQNLREYGIDCSFENANDTRNSLAIDPSNPDTLYVGVEGKGVFKSTDGGSTWNSSSNGILAYPDMASPGQKCYPDMAKMVIDPRDTQRVLLAAADVSTGFIDWSYAETAGIWETLDGGESWHQLITDLTVNAAGTGALALDPGNSDVIYYGVNTDPPTFKEAPVKETLNRNGPLYKSVDNGRTWKEVESGMLPGIQATGVFVNPKDSLELVLLTQAHDHVYHETYIDEVFSRTQLGPMKSGDGGKTWEALAGLLPEPYRNPFDGDVSLNNFDHWLVRPFLFGKEFPPETTRQKSFYTTDGGKTFHETPSLIWIGRYDPHDPKGNHLIGYSPWNAAGDLLESLDAGKTWKAIAKPAELDNSKVKVSNIAWDPLNPSVVYLTGTQAFVWKSTDAGRTWKAILSLETLPRTDSQSTPATGHAAGKYYGGVIDSLPDCAPGMQFTEPPVDLGEVYEISPRGNIGPPGHTFPTDHLFIHLNPQGASTEVFALKAPADVTVVEVRETDDQLEQGKKEYWIYFGMCKDYFAYYNHVKELRGGLKTAFDQGGACMPNFPGCNKRLSFKAKAGEVIGGVGRFQGNFDFGGVNYSKPLAFANPSRYGNERALYISCALDYYSGSLRGQFESKIKRVQEPCGVVMQDVPGTLQGNWFNGDADVAGPWEKHLGFLYDNDDPSIAVASIGGTVSGAQKWEFAPRGAGTTNRRFSDVKPDGLVYCYESNGQKLLARLPAGDELEVELREGTCGGSNALDSPTTYKR
ncbi:MAG TPA: hypothetical protein VJA40_02805 [archaeon]|nr:hypothetical protein [archaeon]